MNIPHMLQSWLIHLDIYLTPNSVNPAFLLLLTNESSDPHSESPWGHPVRDRQDNIFNHISVVLQIRYFSFQDLYP